MIRPKKRPAKTACRGSGRKRAWLLRRWAQQLRAPDLALEPSEIAALTPLIEPLLKEIYQSLHHQRMSLVPQTIDYGAARATCNCGQNPLLACFVAGEKSLIETFIRMRDNCAVTEPQAATALAEVHMVFRKMAGREVEHYCATCKRHSTGSSFPFGIAPPDHPADRPT